MQRLPSSPASSSSSPTSPTSSSQNKYPSEARFFATPNEEEGPVGDANNNNNYNYNGGGGGSGGGDVAVQSVTAVSAHYPAPTVEESEGEESGDAERTTGSSSLLLPVAEDFYDMEASAGGDQDGGGPGAGWGDIGELW